MASLALLLAKRGPGAVPGMSTGLVMTWSAGDRTVNVLGVTYAVDSYEAGLASAGLAPGDTALVLAVGNTVTVLAKMASG